MTALTILAPVHFTVLLERFIESFVLNKLSLSIGDLVGHYQIIIVEDPHFFVLDAQDKMFPYEGMRDDITVAFEANGAVLVDFPIDPVRGVEGPDGRFVKVGLLTLESSRHYFVGCPVNPFVLEVEPPKKIPVGRFTADESVPPPEAFTDEVVGSFNLTLYPGGIGGSNDRFESIVERKTHEGIVELVLSGYLSDKDILHPVVEDLFRHTAKVIEGMDMAIQESRQIAPVDEF
jgi:hypothetical protein